MAVSVLMLNVNGIAEIPKCAKVFDHLNYQKCNIILPQETHLTYMSQGKLWEQQWGRCTLWSPGTNQSSGVGILLKPGSAIEITDHRTDSNGRVLCTKLRSGDSVFQVTNVYAPINHIDRGDFFGNLWCYAFRNIDTVLVSDFNCIPDTKLD